MEEIKKMIPACLIDKMEKEGLSLIQREGGYMLVPSASLLLIDNGGVSGFLARQILEIKELLTNGTESNKPRDGVEQ